MRRFYLERYVDQTGVSGTGKVAEGVQFSDGRCVMRWIKMRSSIAMYENVDDVQAIHGHQGDTHLRWLDLEQQR